MFLFCLADLLRVHMRGRLRRLKPRFSLVRVASLVYMWKGVGQRVRKVCSGDGMTFVRAKLAHT